MTSTPTQDEAYDFAALLEQSFMAQDRVKKGSVLNGTIVAVDDSGVIIDLGLKRDGVVTRSEWDELEDTDMYQAGQDVKVVVTNPEDRDGNLLVSLRQAMALKDWDRAKRALESDESFEITINDANKGGLLVAYGNVSGFIPASHVLHLPQGADPEERMAALRSRIGERVTVKTIEVTPEQRRLVFSEKEAHKAEQTIKRQAVMDSLKVGDSVNGTISFIRDFGAFVDMGDTDGLIHISELSWKRINHPSEVVRVGEKVEAMVVQLDAENQRIGLSLKRLQPNPWEEIAEKYGVGQIVDGKIVRVVSFGAFVELNNGIEALLHISEMGKPTPHAIEDVIAIGETLQVKLITLDIDNQRIGVSLNLH